MLIQLNFFFLGKYYVVDSGYPMMKGYLAPYKEISYHLQDFRTRGGSPRTRHEKFNNAHSSLRCTIERTFGVWKNKWRIIRNMPSFPFHTLEERDIQPKIWWLHVTLICYSHLFCLDGKVQHTTLTFFLILFVNRVTTFRTYHQVCNWLINCSL